MMDKIIGFAISLGLIAWNVIDIVSGKAGTFTWAALGVFSLIGIGEAISIFRSRKPKTAANIG